MIQSLRESGKFEEATQIIKDFMLKNGLTTGHLQLGVFPYSAENMPKDGDLAVPTSYGTLVYYNTNL